MNKVRPLLVHGILRFHDACVGELERWVIFTFFCVHKQVSLCVFRLYFTCLRARSFLLETVDFYPGALVLARDSNVLKVESGLNNI